MYQSKNNYIQKIFYIKLKVVILICLQIHTQNKPIDAEQIKKSEDS